jgi:hypothetical protein
VLRHKLHSLTSLPTCSVQLGLFFFPTAALVTSEIIRPQDPDEILGLIFTALVEEMLNLICTDAGPRYCMINDARMRREPY